MIERRRAHRGEAKDRLSGRREAVSTHVDQHKRPDPNCELCQGLAPRPSYAAVRRDSPNTQGTIGTFLTYDEAVAAARDYVLRW
jgi:hypothetical protein